VFPDDFVEQENGFVGLAVEVGACSSLILYWPGGTSKLMRRPHTGRCRTSSRACWPPGRHDQVRRSRRLPNHQIGSHPDPFDQL